MTEVKVKLQGSKHHRAEREVSFILLRRSTAFGDIGKRCEWNLP